MLDVAFARLVVFIAVAVPFEEDEIEGGKGVPGVPALAGGVGEEAGAGGGWVLVNVRVAVAVAVEGGAVGGTRLGGPPDGWLD